MTATSVETAYPIRIGILSEPAVVDDPKALSFDYEPPPFPFPYPLSRQ